MPQTNAKKRLASRSTYGKRKPLPLKSVIRNLLLNQQRNHTNRIKEIDDQIIETLKSDRTTPAYAWLQVIQTALRVV